MPPSDEKRVLGWRERVDLPRFRLYDLRAKIDTGAYTGALHCHSIRTRSSGSGTRLLFSVLDPSHPQYLDRTHTTRKFTTKKVKSSNGVMEERYVVSTSLRVYDTSYEVKLTLTDRKSLRFPLLLGRTFLRGRFIVDVSRRDLGRNQQRTSP